MLPLAMAPLVVVLAAARATLPAATAALSPVSSLAAVEVASKLLQVPPLVEAVVAPASLAVAVLAPTPVFATPVSAAPLLASLPTAVPPLLALALARVPMAVLTAVASLLPLAATVA